MPHSNKSPLISCQDLQALQQNNPNCLVFDVSFDLFQPAAGFAQYQECHIAGSHYVNLDQHLSVHNSQQACASGGRHPLPKPEDFALTLRQLGVNQDSIVVVYDRNGLNYCGRLWWMLKWVGHTDVYILDGGLQAWQQAGLSTENTSPSALPIGNFQLQESGVSLCTAQQVFDNLGQSTQVILDSRAGPRFRGEVEPLDPQAGHIPGAFQRTFNENLNAQGLFKTAKQLEQEFALLLGSNKTQSIVVHCGSGVSAIPNVVALALAGYQQVSLFAGSWSEWCNNPTYPVAKG